MTARSIRGRVILGQCNSFCFLLSVVVPLFADKLNTERQPSIHPIVHGVHLLHLQLSAIGALIAGQPVQSGVG
ncbi:hypothetical protein B0H12DRAFT_1147056 [Mycena haematopus]|nr:hypothetical protein B0H12DRAFT_1147056 [Mycena haematopus]